MKLSKSERKEVVKKLAAGTSVAGYAFDDALKKKKITEEQLLAMVEHLEILELLSPVIRQNRWKQGKRTEEANKKTKEVEQELKTVKQKLIDFESSEIYQLGKWLMEKLSLSGKERKQELAKQNLVHIADHKEDLGELVETLQEHNRIANEQLEENEQTIQSLENTIDHLTRVVLPAKDAEIKLLNTQGRFNGKAS